MTFARAYTYGLVVGYLELVVGVAPALGLTGITTLTLGEVLLFAFAPPIAAFVPAFFRHTIFGFIGQSVAGRRL